MNSASNAGRYHAAGAFMAVTLQLLMGICSLTFLGPDTCAAERSRLGVLKRQIRSRDPVASAKARAELAAHFCDNGKLRQALELTQDCSSPQKQNVEWPRCVVLAENARCRAASGNLADAIALLNYAEERAVGLPLVIVLEAFGDILAETEEAGKAVEYYKKSLRLGREVFGRKRISESVEEDKKPLHDEWLRARSRILAKKQQAERRFLVEEYGLDYVLYREAQELRTEGNVEEAAARYRELAELSEKSVYGAAAGFYLGSCIQGRGEVEKKLRYYGQFIKEEPLGLYRGEAIYIVAGLWLLEQWEPQRAQKYYQRLVGWCSQARSNQRALRLYTVPQKSREITMPPPDNQHVDEWGIIHECDIPSDKLLNRVVAPWYLDDLEKRARYGLTFCFIVDGKWDDAEKVLDAVVDLDPHLRRAQSEMRPNTYFRLKQVCKLRKVVAEPVELIGASRDLRLRVMYADFLYLQRQFSEAERLYRQVVRMAEKQRSPAAAASALTGLGEVVHMLERREEEKEIYRRVIAEYPREKAAARASFNLANQLSELPVEPDLKEAVELYDRARKLTPETCYAENSLAFSISPLLRLGRKQEALSRAAQLEKEYPQHDWGKVVKNWITMFADAKKGDQLDAR